MACIKLWCRFWNHLFHPSFSYKNVIFVKKGFIDQYKKIKLRVKFPWSEETMQQLAILQILYCSGGQRNIICNLSCDTNTNKFM